MDRSELGPIQQNKKENLLSSSLESYPTGTLPSTYCCGLEVQKNFRAILDQDQSTFFDQLRAVLPEANGDHCRKLSRPSGREPEFALAASGTARSITQTTVASHLTKKRSEKREFDTNLSIQICDIAMVLSRYA